jgi:molybdate-binding protein/DNA-binding PadR family transcriptional regulator
MPKQIIPPTLALPGLLFHGKRYGYELKRTIDQEFPPYWRIDFAQLYRALAAMTKAKWVSVALARGEGGPARKVYSITAEGRAAFREWVAQPARNRDEFFVKVRLANECKIAIPHVLETQREKFQAEQVKQSNAQRAAQEIGNAGQLVVAHAALRETEASLSALDLYEAITVAPRNSRTSSAKPLVITGSDDPLLDQLARAVHTTTHPVGSLGGLIALSQHQADVAGAHLLDLGTGEYNISFVKHLLPEDDIVLVNLAIRENGLIVARGNPKNILGVRDLLRADVRLINRPRGTGTRLLLYAKLRAARIDPRTIENWNHVGATHDAVAAAIATGAADVGPGLRASAVAWNLDFIPLGDEQYDLVIPRDELESPRLEPILTALHSADFRKTAATLAGYDLARSGKIIARVK